MKIMRRGKMVGMGVRFEQPIERQVILVDIAQERICRLSGSAPVTRREIKHRINDRRLLGRGIVYDIADREG